MGEMGIESGKWRREVLFPFLFHFLSPSPFRPTAAAGFEKLLVTPDEPPFIKSFRRRPWGRGWTECVNERHVGLSPKPMWAKFYFLISRVEKKDILSILCVISTNRDKFRNSVFTWKKIDIQKFHNNKWKSPKINKYEFVTGSNNSTYALQLITVQ